MSKKVILHCGMHKTGTSAIQKSLFLSRSELKRRGIIYPSLKFIGVEQKNHSVCLYNFFGENLERYHINRKSQLTGEQLILEQKKIQDQLRSCLNESDEGCFVFSAEDLSSLSASSLGVFKGFLLGCGVREEDICIAIYVREPLSYWASVVQEDVKSGKTVKESVESCLRRAKGFYEKTLSSFAMIFSNVNILSYEEECKIYGGIIPSFYDRYLNYGVENGSQIRENSGLTLSETLLVSELNRMYPRYALDGSPSENREHNDFSGFNGLANGNVNLSDSLRLIKKTFSDYLFLESNFLLSYPGSVGAIDANLNSDLLCSQLDSSKGSYNGVHKEVVEKVLKYGFSEEDLAVLDSSLLSLSEKQLAFKSRFIREFDGLYPDQFSFSRFKLMYMFYVWCLKRSSIDDSFVDFLRDYGRFLLDLNCKFSYRILSLASIVRPGGPLIKKYLSIATGKVERSIKVGVAVITYNRLNYLKSAVKGVKDLTSSRYQLVVADDGSSDGTPEWCRSNGVPCIAGDNRGVVYNKNRALYHLFENEGCDVVILLEDDCEPEETGWDTEWIKSALLWGHINYAHRHILSKEGSIVSGSDSSKSPYISKLVTGQCTAISREAFEEVGYLNPNFRGYGCGHVEWTERFLKLGYDGVQGGKQYQFNVYPCIKGGILSKDAKTFKDEAQLRKNKLVKKKLTSQPDEVKFVFPWLNEHERIKFLSDVEGLI